VNRAGHTVGVALDVAEDVLGSDFQARTIPLGGDDVATLVRYQPPDAPAADRGAVLYVHGFMDYFFQRHLAAHLAARGFAFYALDLRGYGRSLRDHQLPNYVTDLSVYFAELDEAAAIIRGEHGHGRLVVLGHSTGGLVTSLWAHERRGAGVVDALVLNSPWLDLAESWWLRTVGTAVLDVVGRFLPRLVVRASLDRVYGPSLHRDHHGEWEYDLRWKPISGFPVRAGWIRTIRRGHARVHRGLDVRAPVLVMHSDRSLRAQQWSDAVTRADTVLDVAQIARWAPRIGAQVTTVAVEGGLHDLFLSAEPVRARALAEMDNWLDRLPGDARARETTPAAGASGAAGRPNRGTG
jgi:alpha-beta hydrolase superfamily lysophospholipase